MSRDCSIKLYDSLCQRMYNPLCCTAPGSPELLIPLFIHFLRVTVWDAVGTDFLFFFSLPIKFYIFPMCSFFLFFNYYSYENILSCNKIVGVTAC